MLVQDAKGGDGRRDPTNAGDGDLSLGRKVDEGLFRTVGGCAAFTVSLELWIQAHKE